MSETGCPPAHVTSDVTAAFLASTSGKAATERQQQSFGCYARTDDVSDVLLGPAAGNDYFHQHRRHQFRQVAAPLRQQDVQLVAQTQPAPADVYRPDVEHIYESPKHEGLARGGSGSLTGRQAVDDSYYSQHDLRVIPS